MDNENLLTAFFSGNIRYSSLLAKIPPTMMISGLKILINVASPRPNFSPSSLINSIARLSSFFAAVIISLSRISSRSLNFFVRMLVAPFCSAAITRFLSAKPDASVSRQPFFPQRQIISLSKMGICPIHPRNPISHNRSFRWLKYPIRYRCLHWQRVHLSRPLKFRWKIRHKQAPYYRFQDRCAIAAPVRNISIKDLHKN